MLSCSWWLLNRKCSRIKTRSLQTGSQSSPGFLKKWDESLWRDPPVQLPRGEIRVGIHCCWWAWEDAGYSTFLCVFLIFRLSSLHVTLLCSTSGSCRVCFFRGPEEGRSSPTGDDRFSAASHCPRELKSSFSSCFWASFPAFRSVPSCSAFSDNLWASDVSVMSFFFPALPSRAPPKR